MQTDQAEQFEGQTRGGAIPPRSLEAERSVLGELMMNGAAWEAIDGIVDSDDFYDAGHKRIFKCIRALVDDGQAADIVTVAKQLRDSGELERVGGIEALGALTMIQSGSGNLKGHARIIRDYATLRSLIEATHSIHEMAFHPDGREPRAVLDEAESRLLSVGERISDRNRGFQEIGFYSDKVTTTIDKLSKRKDKSEPTGIPTGFIDLDRITSGLQPNELVVIAGRPSMGKTSLALDIAKNVANPAQKCEHGNDVLMFSLEMSGEQLMMRLLGNVGHIDSHKLRSGELSDREMETIHKVIGRVEKLHLNVDDSGDIDVMQIKAKARRLHRTLKQDGRKLAMVIVDYLQLVRGDAQSDSHENRAQAVSNITRGLKALARELNVTVIALSQLNRALEARPNRRPMLADLRESGAIEQDADLIMFLYRESVYNPDEADSSKAEIIIGKHRNGPVGQVNATFLGQYASFRNYASPDDATIP